MTAQEYDAQQGLLPLSHLVLLHSNSEIAEDNGLNERILDLVQAEVSDSVVKRRKQHHKVGGLGIFVHMFGYNWRAFDMTKRKTVGTVRRATKSGKEQLTEFDINFDLNFTIPKYLETMYDMYDQQRDYDHQDIRKDHKVDFTRQPYSRDSTSIDTSRYILHCELTPQREYRDSLHKYFYPVRRDGVYLKNHPNFETKHPSVGFYGLLCNDCNHNCKPEMHPYEWMWWMKVNEGDSSKSRIWNFGLFHEGSNRQKKWSKNPKKGSIAIPFVFDLEKEKVIKIEHLVHGEFILGDYMDSKIDTFDASADRSVHITGVGDVEIEFSEHLEFSSLNYSLSKLLVDQDYGVVSGYFNVSVEVEDLYTCRITFE